MKKLLIGAATALAFALPLSAMAAVNVQDIGTLVNGATSATVAAGESFELTFTADATLGDEIEYVRARARDENNHILSTTCTNVGRKTGDDVEMTADVSTPSDTPQGNIDVLISVYGDAGVAQHNGCTGSSLDSFTFQNIVHVGDNTTEGQSNGNGGGTSNSAPPSWFSLYLQAQCVGGGGTWTAASLSCTHPSAPAPTGNAAKCAAISPYLSAPKSTYSSTGVQLQSALLLDNPNSIPLLAAGATIPMGYRGPQTTAALQAFSNVYGCGFVNIAL